MSDTQIHHHEVHHQPAATDSTPTQIRREALILAIQANNLSDEAATDGAEVTRQLIERAAEFERYITDGAPS